MNMLLATTLFNTAYVMKMVPSVYTLLINTIYLSIPQYTGSFGGTVFRKHSVDKPNNLLTACGEYYLFLWNNLYVRLYFLLNFYPPMFLNIKPLTSAKATLTNSSIKTKTKQYINKIVVELKTDRKGKRKLHNSVQNVNHPNGNDF